MFICCVLLLFEISSACADIHLLSYYYTATSGIANIPEFVTVGMLDGQPLSYYDSRLRREQPRQEWLVKHEKADYWDQQTQLSCNAEDTIKRSMKILMHRFNQTDGIHTLQMMYGCLWDDRTDRTESFDQYGYDGEDYLAVDFRAMSIVAAKPEAMSTKLKLERNRDLLEEEKSYFSNTCIEWLKKYVQYGKDTLGRTVPPEVSLLQRDPSAPVTCHATGFYPKDVEMNWRKNGEDVFEDVQSGEIIPNADGTYQARSHLRVKPEEWKRNKYSCVVQHRNSKDIVVELKEGNIRTNHSGIPWLIITGCVAAVLVAVGIVAGIMVWRKRSTDYKPAAASDSRSENSVPQKV